MRPIFLLIFLAGWLSSAQAGEKFNCTILYGGGALGTQTALVDEDGTKPSFQAASHDECLDKTIHIALEAINKKKAPLGAVIGKIGVKQPVNFVSYVYRMSKRFTLCGSIKKIGKGPDDELELDCGCE